MNTKAITRYNIPYHVNTERGFKMKKGFLFIACILLVFSFSFIANKPFINGIVKSDSEDIKAKLAPYQAIIDKINKEYGSSICIPEDSLLEVYNNVKDTPIAEFEANLRRDYLSVKDTPRYTYVDINRNTYSSNTETDFPPKKEFFLIK